MSRNTSIKHLSRTGLTLAALAMITGMSLGTGPANAVVYCKTVGVPKGCVVRPAVHHHVVYCTTRGMPKGCVVR